MSKFLSEKLFNEAAVTAVNGIIYHMHFSLLQKKKL